MTKIMEGLGFYIDLLIRCYVKLLIQDNNIFYLNVHSANISLHTDK